MTVNFDQLTILSPGHQVASVNLILIRAGKT